MSIPVDVDMDALRAAAERRAATGDEREVDAILGQQPGSPYVRLSVNILPEYADTLQRLATKYDASITEVVGWMFAVGSAIAKHPRGRFTVRSQGRVYELRIPWPRSRARLAGRRVSR